MRTGQAGDDGLEDRRTFVMSVGGVCTLGCEHVGLVGESIARESASLSREDALVVLRVKSGVKAKISFFFNNNNANPA